MVLSFSRGILATIAILAMGSHCLPAEEEEELQHALFNVQVAVLRLADRADAAKDFYDVNAILNLRDRVKLLQRLAASGVESGAADIYAKALNYDAEMINLALRSRDPIEARALVAEAVADLQLKTEFTKGGLNGSPTLKGYVQVKVRTEKADGAEVRGFLIRLSPFGRTHLDPAFFFNNPTPTEQLFPPGRYLMIVMRGDDVVHRQPVELGLAAQDVTEVRIIVP
jgi:hypothetical protein